MQMPGHESQHPEVCVQPKGGASPDVFFPLLLNSWTRDCRYEGQLCLADEPQSHERGTMSSSSTKELGSFRESQT